MEFRGYFTLGAYLRPQTSSADGGNDFRGNAGLLMFYERFASNVRQQRLRALLRIMFTKWEVDTTV
jgi:hypothetical protein